MTLEEARELAEGLTTLAHDPEAAHSQLDALLEAILKEIVCARDGDTCQEFAAIALDAIRNVPVRWCA